MSIDDSRNLPILVQKLEIFRRFEALSIANVRPCHSRSMHSSALLDSGGREFHTPTSSPSVLLQSESILFPCRLEDGPHDCGFKDSPFQTVIMMQLMAIFLVDKFRCLARGAAVLGTCLNLMVYKELRCQNQSASEFLGHVDKKFLTTLMLRSAISSLNFVLIYIPH